LTFAKVTNKAIGDSRLLLVSLEAAADWCRHLANLTNFIGPRYGKTWRNSLNRKYIHFRQKRT